jgi:glycerol kinase
MIDIIEKQVVSTNLVIGETGVKRVFVDGGFSNNEIYMNLLANAYSDKEVYGAMIPQASAMGAALAIHHAWNSKQIPNDIIQLQFFRNQAFQK